jgi:hypothetical protein
MKHIKFGRGYINDDTVEGNVYNINLGEINPNDVEWFTNRLRQSLRREIPMDYIRVRGLNNNEDTIENNTI